MTPAESELIEATLAILDTPTLMALAADVPPDPWYRLKTAIRNVKRQRAEISVRLDESVTPYCYTCGKIGCTVEHPR